jgi:magnesium transporter
MISTDRWVDLLDPAPDDVRAQLPGNIHDRALDQILAPSVHGDEPRPVLESHGDYIFGLFLVPVVVPEEDLLYYQEFDLIATADKLITIRKTPSGGHPPFDIDAARMSCAEHDPVGLAMFHLVDDVAERFLDVVDGLNDEIEELDDGIDTWDSDRIRRRISDLRHGILEIRKIQAPTRDAIREVVDDRVELEGAELFTRDVELSFGGAYDKLLRANDGLELSRDLVAGARDYHQSKISNEQNEVMKRLTVIAALLLLPTFIVGLYGQNFVKIPELHWSWGYWFSWGLIVVTTIGQLLFFKRKKWL